MASKTEMEMGMRNGVIGTIIILLSSLIVRLGSWFIFINSSKKIVDDAKSLTLILLLVGVLLPTLSYLIMYNSYAKKGARDPMRLRAISQGQSWVGGLIILIITEIFLFGALFASMSLMYSRYLGNGITCAVIGMVVDLVLFVLGKIFFKPDMVQRA